VLPVQRLAALVVLTEREQRLSAVQRLVVVDAAARLMDEEGGNELAWALLDAVCSTTETTSHTYLALLARPDASAPEDGAAPHIPV
jgi:hypothetical protein